MSDQLQTISPELTRNVLLERLETLRSKIGLHARADIAERWLQSIEYGLRSGAKPHEKTRARFAWRKFMDTVPSLAEYLVLSELLIQAASGVVPSVAGDTVRLDDLEFSIRTTNCLKDMGLVTIGDLTKKTEAELLRSSYFGRKSVNEIKAVLKTFNRVLAG